MSHSLQLNPDRLFPAEPSVRAIARRLYAEAADLPIISPHGHVPAQWLSDNIPFGNPTQLLITPDHYVNRLMHAQGVSLSDLGVGQAEFSEEQSRNAFRLLCKHWPIYRGTSVKFWFESTFVDVFGIDVRPSEETADQIYDQIAEKLASPEYTPRALFDRFGIEFIATTDDPLDDLAAHEKIAADPTFPKRVAPTFRPDKYLEPARPDWIELTDKLAEVSGVETGTYAGWVEAMRQRRRYFIERGGVSTDHSHADPRTDRVTENDAERLFAAARAGHINEVEAVALRRHMLAEMGELAAEDGLVMTLHPAVARNHHGPTFEKYGADVGADIPISVEYTRALQPMLNRVGTAEGFQLVLFTLDETTFSREIAPLAGFYQGVYAGAPWWFLDAPEAIRRYRSAVTDTCGFTKTSGFIDDTRAFCSIPARHDMARRLDAGFLAGLVADHRLEEDEAVETMVDLTSTNPRKAFKL